MVLNFLTMSSREIADLVDSRHDKVKQSIERLSERGIIVQPPVVDEHGEDAMGRTRVTQVYVFSGDRGKRDSIIAVAQLSPEFTARLVDRWQELEAQQGPKLPTTMAEALRLGQSAQRGLRRTLQPLVQMWSASGAHSTQANSPRAPTIARHSSTVVRELPGIKIDRPPQR